MIVVHHSGTPRQHVLCETEVDMLKLRAVTVVESPRTPLDTGVIGDPFGTPIYVGRCPCAPDEVNEVPCPAGGAHRWELHEEAGTGRTGIACAECHTPQPRNENP